MTSVANSAPDSHRKRHAFLRSRRHRCPQAGAHQTWVGLEGAADVATDAANTAAGIDAKEAAREEAVREEAVRGGRGRSSVSTHRPNASRAWRRF